MLDMKLAACRDVDFDDAVRLIQEIGYRDVDQVLDLMDQAWSHANISLPVEYFTRGVFEEATQGHHTPSAELLCPPPRTAVEPILDLFDCTVIVAPLRDTANTTLSLSSAEYTG